MLAISENRFKLRVAFEALRHVAHCRPRGFVTGHVARLILALAGAVELLPALHEAIRTNLRIGAQFSFELEGADGAVDLASGRFRGKLRVLLVGGFSVMGATGPHLLEGFAGFLQFLHLLRAGPATLLLHLEDRIHGASMADERPLAGAAQRRFRVFGHPPFRRFPFRPQSAIGGQAQPVEHAAHLLRHHLAHDLGDTLAEGDPAPLGIVLRRIGAPVIRRHILGPVARQGADEPALVGEVVVTVMQIKTVAMARQGDIAAVGVEDGATVPIYYTARLARLHLDADARAVLDEGSDELLEGEEETERERHKSKWSRLEAVAGAPERIKIVAGDIVSHFESRRDAMGGGKGMVVAMSRRIAVALYDEIAKLRLEWAEGGRMNVVMTGNASDPAEFKPHIRKKSENKKLANRFKDPVDPFNLVIVRDMWLTGFDAPCLHTLYVDKPMRGHGLMQAVARVNRVFGEKPGGLIVDYMGLGAELQQALAAYSQTDREQTARDQELAIQQLVARHEAVIDFLSGVNWPAFFEGDAGRRLTILKQTVEYILSEESGRKRYLDLATALASAFALAAGTPEAARLREEVAFMLAVRANLVKYTGGRARDRHEIELELSQLLSRAVVADGLLDVFREAGFEQPNISVLSDEFLDEVRSMEQKNLAIEALRRLVNGEILSREKQNVVEARRFSERLEEAIARYHNRAIDSVQVIQELIDLAKEMRASLNRGDDLGLDADEIAFYDALAENQSAIDVLGSKGLRELAQELVRRMKPLVTVDWAVKENIRAKLRVEVRRLLRRYGYPPDFQQMAIDLVMEQANVVCEKWVDT